MKIKGKNILLGVTGSIAAYKAAFLIRLLVKEGANVQVVMTEAAKDFIAPLTLATLSKNPVHSDLYNRQNGDWTNHVELGIWADAMIIAPATANTISKMANGACDNLLSAVYLSARCPVFYAPAMDLDMFKHPAVKFNMAKLHEFGTRLIDANSGELASGLDGKGRMAEPEDILKVICSYFEI